MLNNFQYSVEYEYDTEYSCAESGCDEEGICRCSRISNAFVYKVNVDSLTNALYEQLVDVNSSQGKRENKLAELFYGGPEVDKYCINRILTHYKVWDGNSWDISVTGGYYGDEIDEVMLDNTIFNAVSLHCSNVLELSTISEKIKYVLNLEYGFILDDIKNADFELIDITFDQIDLKKVNQSHVSNVKSENLEYYNEKNYHFPRGVVRRSADHFKIVDGFHRIISASKTSPFKVFVVK